MPYLINSTRLSKAGSWVELINDSHYPVMIVRNEAGELHSVHVDNLSDVKPEEPVGVREVVFDLFNQG